MDSKIFTLLLSAAGIGLAGMTHTLSKPAFSYEAYGNVANYFEHEKDLVDFFEFEKGDVVAEVGAADGENIGGFSLLSDSITFYVQDIDPKSMNAKKFN